MLGSSVCVVVQWKHAGPHANGPLIESRHNLKVVAYATPCGHLKVHQMGKKGHPSTKNRPTSYKYLIVLLYTIITFVCVYLYVKINTRTKCLKAVSCCQKYDA